MSKIKVGDIVISTKKHDSYPKGTEGVVKFIHGSGDCAVELDKDADYGHKCEGNIKSGNGYWLPQDKLKVVGIDRKTVEMHEDINLHIRKRTFFGILHFLWITPIMVYLLASIWYGYIKYIPADSSSWFFIGLLMNLIIVSVGTILGAIWLFEKLLEKYEEG